MSKLTPERISVLYEYARDRTIAELYSADLLSLLDERAELAATAPTLEAALRTEYETTHKLVTAHDQLKAEVERMRPVYQAAKRLCEFRRAVSKGSRHRDEMFQASLELAHAIDSALAAESETK